MKNKLLYFILIAIVSSCGPALVHHDYDSSTDFNQFKTYNYFEEMPNLELSELDVNRVFTAIDNQMKVKGFSLSEEAPDVLINIVTSLVQASQQNTMGVGLGGGSRGVGGGISIGIPFGGSNEKQLIRLELIDAQTNQLIWFADVEAANSNNSNPDKRQLQFNKIAQAAFTKYPPKAN